MNETQERLAANRTVRCLTGMAVDRCESCRRYAECHEVKVVGSWGPTYVVCAECETAGNQ